MVIQHALETTLFAKTDSSSGNSRPTSSCDKGCLELVKEAIDGYMVRGSHSPMQWMLDLRTYGLKIHHNTTAGETIEGATWKHFSADEPKDGLLGSLVGDEKRESIRHEVRTKCLPDIRLQAHTEKCIRLDMP